VSRSTVEKSVGSGFSKGRSSVGVLSQLCRPQLDRRHMSAAHAFDQARKRLRQKLGLPAAATRSEIAATSASESAASPPVSVMHRVLEFEDKRQEPEVLPLPEALSHSLSGSWKQLVLETGKPAWERDQRESPSEVRLVINT
jgi:hypothetical protein